MNRRNAIISIHVPREGHDSIVSGHSLPRAVFLSTCPVRGTTLIPAEQFSVEQVFLSTCPVRGTTTEYGGGEYWHGYFYPRAP